MDEEEFDPNLNPIYSGSGSVDDDEEEQGTQVFATDAEIAAHLQEQEAYEAYILQQFEEENDDKELSPSRKKKVKTVAKSKKKAKKKGSTALVKAGVDGESFVDIIEGTITQLNDQLSKAKSAQEAQSKKETAIQKSKDAMFTLLANWNSKVNCPGSTARDVAFLFRFDGSNQKELVFAHQQIQTVNQDLRERVEKRKEALLNADLVSVESFKEKFGSTPDEYVPYKLVILVDHGITEAEELMLVNTHYVRVAKSLPLETCCHLLIQYQVAVIMSSWNLASNFLESFS